MRMVIFFASLTVLISCGGSGTAISKQLSGTDSLVINFNTPQSNTIEKTVTTTDPTAIKKLSNYVDGKASANFKCGYDGNLLFYKNGALAGDVSFNYSGEGCQHFMMLVNNQLTPTKMSNEAASFLKSLAEGKGWY